jgi:acyl-coenzyme A thioesterase PaaI-like protein
MPDGWVSSTTSYQVHNLEPAFGERLIAIGRSIKVSKSSGVGGADVYANRGDESIHVATVTATCRLFQLTRP